MTENKFLIDSSAWVEYFDGTSLGVKVKKILDNGENTCYSCGPVLAEVVSKLVRKGFDSDEHFKLMKQKTTFLVQTSEEWSFVGQKHAVMRREMGQISYTDSLLLVLSELHHLKIVSKDAHLKGPNTIFLR